MTEDQIKEWEMVFNPTASKYNVHEQYAIAQIIINELHQTKVVAEIYQKALQDIAKHYTGTFEFNHEIINRALQHELP